MIEEKIKVRVIKFEQPAGYFFIGAMPTSEILQIARATPRRYNPEKQITEGGGQRPLSDSRVQEIAKYANTIDASFPTAVILSINSEHYELNQAHDVLQIANSKVADIVDGQHRLAGLKESGNNCFEIPVVFILDATFEQEAYLFATINGKQTKVSTSLIYDLFGEIEYYSPFKVTHEIARALNRDKDSPWFKRLKMLGLKSHSDSNESLSQGTFIKELLSLISKKPYDDLEQSKRNEPFTPQPNCPLNCYFIKKQTDIIYKIVFNVFSAIRRTWPEEWDNSQSYIVSKTVGFTGFMKALPEILEKGKEEKRLNIDFFEETFARAKDILQAKKIILNSSFFPSSGQGAKSLKEILLQALKLENVSKSPIE